MPLEFSPVIDNSLLPFATPGSVAIPRGDDNISDLIAIGSIFEDGFLFGADRMNRLQIETNGQIQFTTVAGNQSATIALMFFDQDTRTLPPGVANAGIWLDYNTERDSVVITWNGVGQFSQMVEWPSTYQVEIRDLGDGDAEIIYRFNDLTYASPLYGSYFIYSYGLVNSPLPRMGTLDLWDDTPGNTGVTGVWQFRIEDGRVLAEDLEFPPQILIGTAGDDSLTGGLGDDRLNGLGGNDTLTGGAGQDVIMGGNGDNQLYGGAANDTIIAGDGDDYIDGGRHSDLIGAGGGNDTILSAEGTDTIYGAGGDDLILGTDNVNQIQAYGGDGNDTIAGGRGSSILFGEDGNDVLSAVSGFNTLDGGNGDDTLSGGVGTDRLYGAAGDDSLFGALGNDTLVGGEGADTLDGGAGTDQAAYFLETGTRGVVVDLGAGTAIDTFGSMDVLIGIEQVIGSDLADRLTGSMGGDILFGRAGADLLQGLGGDDTLVGGAGNDTINGGGGGDQVAYFLETGTQGVVVDMRAGTATDTFGSTDTLIGIEYVHGSNFNDTILGSDVDGDRIFGRDGDDFIDGRDGSNLIYTGAGNDHIVVGTTLEDARDTVVIDGPGVKRITGTGALGTAYAHHLVFDLGEGVVVNLATGIAQSANMTLDFTQALHFLEVGGTAYDDHLIGGNPAHDYLEWLSGNQGNDTLDGGAGRHNTVIYDDEVRYGGLNYATGQREYGNRGVVVNLTTGVATDSFGFTDTLINIHDIRATEFADNLFGTSGANGFWGLKGADTINGGAGQDQVFYGEDSVTGGLAGVTVDLGAGFAIDGFGDRDTLISIEEAYGSDFNDTMRGSAEGNRLFGYKGDDHLSGLAGNDTLDGGLGNDSLYGGAGDDELWGGAGNDTLDGGAGTDIARYLTATGGITANMATGLVGDGMGGTDTLINIEGVHGSDHGDTLQGGDAGDDLRGFGGNDVIYGGAGADTVLGGTGDDRLFGGAGDDEIWGEAGNDTIDGGAGSDLVRYRNSDAGVVVNLASGSAQDGLGGTDSLSGIENVDGSDHADRLTGDSGINRLFGFAGNDTIDGGAGNDVILGGAGNDSLLGGAGDDEIWGGTGNDTILGGDGSDLVRYRGVPGAIRADLETGIVLDGEGGTDSLSGVENIDGSDQGDVILGNGAANRLFGFGGNDRIEGRGGNDTLLGGDGDDALFGGAGDDQLEGGAGSDTLDGGAGSDLVRYRTATGAMTIDLAAGTAAEAGGATDILIGIENADGSDLGDKLTGNAEGNRLFGFAGSDTIAGGTGDDTLVGGTGGDTYIYRAGDGYDVINDLGDVGGPADLVIVQDYLASQARIYQQGNNIVLDFGVTRDVVVLANSIAANSTSTIESVRFADGAVWTHAMLVGALGQLATPTISLGSSDDDTLFGTTGGDTIEGGAGNDLIHGLAGDDTLDGGQGNDTIHSGDGNDLVYGGAGNDLLILGAGVDTVDGGTGSDTVVFDLAFAGINDAYAVDGAGVFTILDNRISGVETFRFADRNISATELAAMARNAAPVSTLPAAISTNEGVIALDLAPFFTDAEGDVLQFSAADLPVGITLTGSTLTGQLQAGTVPFAITIIVSDGIHELRRTLDWTILNINAAPTGTVTVTGTAGTGQVLTAQSSVADADGIDPATQRWTWLRDGAPISGATGESYTLTATDIGARITARLSYTDLFGTAESVTSTATAPVIATPLFLTGTAGADVLRGGPGNDTINGLDGGDLLEGLEGDDSLLGGEGTDTLIGGAGDDFLFGGSGVADLRDVIFGGDGNDYIDGGWGNDELHGGEGNDTVLGDFGSDTLIGNAGNDLISGGAGSDLMSGGPGNDTLNGGWGFDRMNGGAGADRFFHAGVADHASDWIQDYNAAEGDVLVFGLAGATRAQFQVNTNFTPRAGAADVEEAFIIYRPTGQIMWALVDGDAQTSINLQLSTGVFDLLA